jgi:2-polyprenyl-6-methoxyphenol hydroxylase-like FAD-dependent oxidoreductase
VVRINGETAGEFHFSTIVPEYPYAIWMPQPIFLQALVQKAAALPSFQCWMGARVSELLEENGTVLGVQGHRHGQEPFAVRANVVIGADGRYSRLRRLGNFEIEYQHHDFDVIWFVIEQPPDWPNTIYISLGQDVRGLILPKYPHHLQAGIFLPTDAWRHWREQGIAEVAARVKRFDPVFTAFAESLHDFTPFFPLEGRILLLKDWTRDGLLMIGDAAHTMSPAGAIGVNVALATAAIAAQEIYPLLGHGPVAQEDLRAVQQLREGDVRTLHRFQLGAQRATAATRPGLPLLRSKELLVDAWAQRVHLRKAGMTSSAKRVSCSWQTACGVPMANERTTRSTAGYFASSSCKKATASAGVPHSQFRCRTESSTCGSWVMVSGVRRARVRNCSSRSGITFRGAKNLTCSSKYGRAARMACSLVSPRCSRKLRARCSPSCSS